MKHVGDITKLSGYDLPVVDVITGGSPCQDLSVAGKRAGLDGERSGLFMEQVRIVKEMREKDGQSGRSGFLVRPRWLVWENVPGAFSSNAGEDFATVLQEIAKIVCKEAPPVPVPKDGWPKAGCISGVGDSGCTFSIAWRLHDAQYWGATQFINDRVFIRGTPQRRKRISLVADFGGLGAPEILFERAGLSGNSEPSKEEGKGTPEGTERSSGETGFYDAYQHHGWRRNDISGPMTVGQNNTIRGDTPMVLGDERKCLNGWDVQSKHIQQREGTAETLYSGECRYGGGESYVFDNAEKDRGYGETGQGYWQPGIKTIRAEGENRPSRPSNVIVEEPIPIEVNGSRESHKGNGYGEAGDPCFTLNSIEQHGVAIPINTMVGTRDTEEKRTTFGVGEDGDPQFTISAAHEHAVMCFEQNQREEVRDLGEQSSAVKAESGMHNQTFVAGFKPRNGSDARTVGYEEEKAPTISTDENYGVVTAYGISAYESNAMKSSNPHSGIYKADTSRTLDLTGGSPACNQGGVAVVAAVDCRNGTEDECVNASLQSSASHNLKQQRCEGILVLNDQGGAVMHISYDVISTLRAETKHHEPIVLLVENHPHDSRVGIRDDGICQSLTGRMGTGGNNVPLVMLTYEDDSVC